MWINHDDYIEAVEKNSGPLNRIAGFQETIAVQLRAIKEEQQRLVGFFTEGSEIKSNIDILAANQVQVCKGIDAIREGQDKLLQSHAGLEKHLEFNGGAGHTQYMQLTERLDGLRDFVHTQVSHSQHSIEDFQDKYHVEITSSLAALQKELEFNSTETIKLAQSHGGLTTELFKALAVVGERLANIEVAFTVRLEALEQRIVALQIGSKHDVHRTNGKYPAGKRK